MHNIKFEKISLCPMSALFCLTFRWGLMQFKRNMHDKSFHWPRWSVYKALFDVFDAMMVSLTDMYSSNETCMTNHSIGHVGQSIKLSLMYSTP